ncbi:MAG: flagellar hook-basal body protein [Solibacillus sp.]
MFKGFYTVATGMVAQQRKTEILTNNMANANTPGFKADQSTIRSFPDMLMSAVSSTTVPTENGFALKQLKTVGELNAGVYLQETLANHMQGSIYSTGLSTDVALRDGNYPIDEESGNMGTVLFRLENPAGGESYTRNGNFTLDGQGNLVTPAGLFLLSDTGERIQLENDNFQIEQNGMIYDDNGQQVATVGVSFVANPDVLVKRDNGLYNTIDETELPSAYNQDGVDFTMQQSYLEGSNVDASKSMTELMTAYRAFEANQKVLTAYDRSMEKAVTEIGRVQ